MLHTGSRLLRELPLIFVTAAATHLVVSFFQTLMHFKLGHHAMGGSFAITSTSIMPTIRRIILSQPPTSMTKATIRLSSSFPYLQ